MPLHILDIPLMPLVLKNVLERRLSVIHKDQPGTGPNGQILLPLLVPCHLSDIRLGLSSPSIPSIQLLLLEPTLIRQIEADQHNTYVSFELLSLPPVAK